jgi:hypothetical protein
MTDTAVADPMAAVRLAEILLEPHEALVDERTWLKANVDMIENDGSEPYLRNLLFTLSGNFPTGDSGFASPADVAAMLVNPFYAIEIDPQHAQRTPEMSEDAWVQINRGAIEELGAEGWLLRLLSTLKGNAGLRSAKIGRNDKCPCGSGKKFKNCHGA